jgi:hypothetical protein
MLDAEVAGFEYEYELPDDQNYSELYTIHSCGTLEAWSKRLPGKREVDRFTKRVVK